MGYQHQLMTDNTGSSSSCSTTTSNSKPMDLLQQLQKEERIVPFLRRSSLDWDFVRGQLLELDPDEKLFLKSWCQRIVQLLEGSLLGLDLEDRLLRLESDKDALHIQVSILSDQIDVQTGKIHDLEKVLDDKKNVLDSTQETLSRELLTRSSLETQKLELMTEISSLRLKQAALERENFDLRDRFGATEFDQRLWAKPPLGPVVGHLRSPSPTLHHQNGYGDGGNSHRSRVGSAGSEMVTIPVKPLSRPRTPPANAYRRVDQTAFGTLPRRNQASQLSAFNNGGSSIMDETPPRQGKSSSLNSRKSHAVQPQFKNNYAAIEREEWERKRLNSSEKKSPSSHKSRGILRILSKLKRSNSGGLDDIVPESSQFTRGGLRATAQPRLGWISDPFAQKKPSGPVHLWDSDSVILWLSCMGLSMYSNEVKRWVKSGQQLLDATSKELEKELGMKNPLHKKKLQLAINALKNPNDDDSPGKLDYHWVIRWLDDIGLPQYKEAFGEARVDGRVLSQLTAEDLVFLKVTSLLHHMSIKRGIQLLRIHKFHPGCLCRRGVVGMSRGSDNLSPEHVATWSNHRVMEWLRAVELSEYAPNLRGSGVHGALLILEPKFNADLLATLLSIPTDKTLLRRHVNQEVNDLVGRNIMQEKRKVEMSPEFVPLSPTFKVKIGKSIKVFNLRKKRNSLGTDEILCPLEWNYFPFVTDSHQLETSRMEDESRSAGNTTTTTTNGDKISNI